MQDIRRTGSMDERKEFTSEEKTEIGLKMYKHNNSGRRVGNAYTCVYCTFVSMRYVQI